MFEEGTTLTERQAEILRRVVEEYVESGEPVGSKNLVARAGMTVSPSTVRVELAELERFGLLMHPHTSAGPRADRGRLSALRGFPAGAARAAPEPVPARSRRCAQRARSRAPGDDRDPLAGHASACARLRAAAPDGDRAAHRGARPPAAGADGRDDHVHRWSVEAALCAGRLRRPGPCALGGRVPERGACRARARERCAAPPASTIRRCPLASAPSSNCCAPRSPS